MQSILKVKNVNIYASDNDKISFFNSPYYAHRMGKALDIYSPLSPIDGKVKKIVKIGNEHLILIECSDNLNIRAKILHIKSKLKENECVSAGDRLGTLVRSKFFQPWTEEHIHLELRNPEDAVRARGGYNLIELKNTEFQFEPLELNGRVESCLKHYILFSLPDKCFKRVGQFHGLRYGNGILCGGIPHYGFGCFYSKYTNNFDFKLFNTKNINAHIGNIRLRGISLYLHLKKTNIIKLIPEMHINLKESSYATLRVLVL